MCYSHGRNLSCKEILNKAQALKQTFRFYCKVTLITFYCKVTLKTFTYNIHVR